MIVLVMPFMKHAGMALYPFVLVNKAELKSDTRLIHHEKIHLRQQQEMLVLPFYLIYVACYFYNLYRFRDHYTAYVQIPFEREAYKHESKPGYLAQRKFWAWLSA